MKHRVKWLLGVFILFWLPLKGAEDPEFKLSKLVGSKWTSIYNSNIESDNLHNHDWYLILLNKKVISEDVLLIEMAQIDSLFIFLKSRNSIPLKYGRKVYYAEKKYLSRNIFMPVSELQSLNDSIFIKIDNKSFYNASVVLKTKSAVKDDELLLHLLIGFYSGIVFLFVMFQAIVFTKFRIFNYNFYYLLYLLITYTYFMTEFGFCGLYVWKEAPHLEENISYLIIIGSGAYLSLFVYDFLKVGLPVFFAKIIKANNAIMVLTAIFILTGLYHFNYFFSIVIHITVLSVTVSFMLAFVMSVIGVVRQVKNSIFLLCSITFIVLGALLKTLSYTGVIDANFITNYGAILGHLIEVLILSTVMVNLGLSQIKLSEKLKEENLLLEKTALSALISPHFIFNGLNSIQAYIMINDKKGAMDFISKYSTIIRLSLNSLNQQFITIADEISFLDTYLSLEKIKKHYKTDFKIENKISDPIDKVLIPPMMIQPFVENALLHGIKKIPHEGYIHIKFDKVNDYVIVEITDNGVGIEQSDINNKHLSLGSSLTRKRLELINKTTENVIVYSKLYPENKQYPGTKVTLTIKTL